MKEEKNFFTLLLIFSFSQMIYLNLISLFHFEPFKETFLMGLIETNVFMILPPIFFIITFLKMRKKFQLNNYKIFIIFLLFIIFNYLIFVIFLYYGIENILDTNIFFYEFTISSNLIADAILLLIWLIFVILFFVLKNKYLKKEHNVKGDITKNGNI